MGKIFGYDSPAMRFVRLGMNLILLNMLTILCCIPLFTIGASLSAAHSAAVRLRRDEGHVSANFFEAFVDNFKQATLVWLIFVAVVVFFISDYYICTQLDWMITDVAQVVLVVLALALCLISMWLYPLIARYENKLRHTLKNAATMTVAYLPSTFAMLIVTLLPVGLFLLVAEAFIVVLAVGISLPIYLNSALYCKIFDKVEAIQEEAKQEEET